MVIRPNLVSTGVEKAVLSFHKLIPRKLCVLLWLGLLVSSGCDNAPKIITEPTNRTVSEQDIKDESFPKRIASENLPNPVQLHAKVISGGTPEGEASFRELKKLGIKTIISVDGMEPDLELAKRFQLRYVHLPIGYDGIEPDRAIELAKAVNDLDGPIYLHCHHGKHRSPAAAAVACVGAGLISSKLGLETLEVAGTSHDYVGLHQAARDANPVDANVIASLDANFPAKATLEETTALMVKLDHVFERLKSLEKNDWLPLPSHPDLVASHEALILSEHFAELLRLKPDDALSEGQRYFESMKASQEQAAMLAQELKAYDLQKNDPLLESTRHRFARIAEQCKSCHREFRDTRNESGTDEPN